MNATKHLSLDEIEQLLDNAHFPNDLFGEGDWAGGYKHLQVALHPDRYPSEPDKIRAEGLFRRLGSWKTLAETPEHIESGSKTYTLGQIIAKGDLSTVRYAHENPGKTLIAKIGETPGTAKLLLKERETLDVLLEKVKGSGNTRYYPNPVDSFLLPDKRRVNLFQYVPGLHTLEAVKAAHPKGINPRHLVWMFKRLMGALSFAHKENILHTAVLPPHILVDVANHGIVLADWTLAIPVGKPTIAAPSLYKHWYPPECHDKKPASTSTDIFLAVMSLCDLMGGDTVTGMFPEIVPQAMRTFFKGCLLQSSSMRPTSAGELFGDMADLAQRVFGAPQFIELSV